MWLRLVALAPPLLVASAEQALMKWKFRKDFGLSSTSHTGPEYALLNINFDFKPNAPNGEHQTANASADLQLCAHETESALDERSALLWLSSDELMRRVIQKKGLSFSMLGHGHLQGAVRLDIRIDERGDVECVQAVGGDPIAVSSAMAGIRDWRFRPFVRRGKAMAVHRHLTIRYEVAR
jgi:hypothetical protein